MMRAWLAELYRRDRVLAIVGWLMIGLFAALLAVAPFDQRQVMEINPYLKPMKFSLSIAAYVWTVAWFMGYLKGPRPALWAIRLGISGAMLVEIVCIVLQAARGVTSHYNCATAFDCRVFQLMGQMILLNTVFIVVLLLVLLQPLPALPTAYRWGIRIGVLLLLLGSGEGVVMIRHMAHTVGAPDGGPGLPLLNWSTRAGDLRAAHLLAIHGLQVIPLVGWFISSRWKAAPVTRQMVALLLFTLVYVATAVYLYDQALSGRPVISL